MKAIPRDKNLDSTLALLREGYEFISKRCERYHSDIFETRFMFQKAICMRGKEAAQMFYEGERFTRQGALPKTTLMLLQDKGSAQTLDGEPHRHRKQMFMSLMSPEAIERLTDTMAGEWEAYLGKWQDLYGTNRDPNAWDNPEAFRPERFRQWDRSAFNFIPQGGGEHYQSHRCAGEWITIALMKRAVRLLTTAMDYEVPRQDLRIDLNRMPAIPRSRLVISHVRRVRYAARASESPRTKTE